jgi:hypothetical protein
MNNQPNLDIYPDLTVLGDYKDPDLIVDKLQQMNHPQIPGFSVQETFVAKSAVAKDYSKGLEFFGWWTDRPWKHTSYQIGYIAPGSSKEPKAIAYPGAIAPDLSLKNGQINIRLDRLRIFDYPGSGMHNILTNFTAFNQVQNAEKELVSFSQTYRVQEGQSAAIAGYPIFIGLNVGSQGVALECATVNVKNDEDEALLAALESQPFKQGLNLLQTAQPAIAPFTKMTKELVSFLGKRNQNVPVQKFSLGLDFEDSGFGIRLAEGNYIVAQVPSHSAIEWEKWHYDPNIGAIVHKADRSDLLPYNYLVFRVSRYQE